MLRSAAKNHESVTVVVDPADYAEVAKQIAANGNTTLGIAPQTCRQSFRAHCGLRCRHRRAFLRQAFEARRRSGASARHRSAIHAPLRAAAALRRKSASGRRALRPLQRIFPAAPRQGTFLQQHPGPDGRGRSLIAEFAGDAADAGHSQAHQSLRRRPGHNSARGLGQGVRHGQTGAVRRHHRRQPDPRLRLRRSHLPKSSAKSSSRPDFRPRPGDFAKEKKSAPAQNAQIARATPARGICAASAPIPSCCSNAT